jgi:hypothetical protein
MIPNAFLLKGKVSRGGDAKTEGSFALQTINAMLKIFAEYCSN